ncbi:MAG: TonB-dependent receptor [Cellulophaga sp.]
MKNLPFVFLIIILITAGLQGQAIVTISGEVLSQWDKKEIGNVVIEIENHQILAIIDSQGKFKITTSLVGNYILYVHAPDFISKRIPIILENEPVSLGIIYLERDITLERSENLITLTESDLSEVDQGSITSGLLQATKDIFLRRAAFDFGQAFFKVRGYGSENGVVLLNGIAMNKLANGRPQWNNWGGLNDVTRNQEFIQGLLPSKHHFGSILGTTNIDTRPSGFRPGIRISTSFSNRTYVGRVMATYSSGIQKNGWSYSVSASRRWAKQGYMNGTLYDAFSLFGALEYKINEKQNIYLTTVFASNRRGRSSALTQEIFGLIGRKYNPYWGEQKGEIRNSRESKVVAPIFMLNHTYKTNMVSVNTGLSYLFGANSKSRLGYYNAPNPDPSYYRNLPSFYINSPIGANFNNAALAEKAFLENHQLNWEKIYTANAKGNAASYVLYNDVTKDNIFNVKSTANIKISKMLSADFGFTFQKLTSANYAKIKDLLGAEHHLDIDAFSTTKNDIHGVLEKKTDAIFNYHYNLNVQEISAFAQLKFQRNKWNGFLAGNYANKNYQREGVFQNERFLENSNGLSFKQRFLDVSVKGGLGYRITGRHWLQMNLGNVSRAPTLQNTFINPRENNYIIPNLKSEKITTFDFSYFMRLPSLTGRITSFFTNFKQISDVNFFFINSGVGSDFVQEVVTDISKQHIGVEIGLEYKASASVNLSAVMGLGKYTYTNNPNVAINFDTSDALEEVLDLSGNIDLGKANINNFNLAQGPQKAFAFGVEYRDPKYWWISATTNFLGNNYANISTILRTKSFYLNPETGVPFLNATEENVRKALAQKKLDDFYLLNLVGGKSWLVNKRYISVFVSINNVFDAVYRTGGYEQSRNGNYAQFVKDNLGGSPSFGNKYWYGYGRTYFINLAFSF